jgi:gas vesicle protein
MEWTTLFLGLFAGLILGAVAVLLWQKGKGGEALQLLQQAREQERADMGQRIAERENRLAEMQEDVVKLNRTLSAEEQRNTGLAEKLETQKAELETLNERMTKEFKHIASTLMEKKASNSPNSRKAH